MHAGLLALGHHHGVDTATKGEPGDLEIAEDLMRTCYEMYRRSSCELNCSSYHQGHSLNVVQRVARYGMFDT